MTVVHRIIIIFFFVLTFVGKVYAQDQEIPIILEEPKLNTRDAASIQRGAKTYATYCLLCHALDYMEYDPFAKRAGIVPSRMPDKNKNWWFGSYPPNLTLIARVRGADWVYTYLHVFYKDPKRPTGSNNLLLNNSNMPNPFVGLQGVQELIVNKELLIKEHGVFDLEVPYYTILELTQKGSLSPDEFDKMITDLVNFLVYASEPKKYTRETIGIGVLIFIALFYLVVLKLKRSYWNKK